MASISQRGDKWRCLVLHAGRRIARTFPTEEEARAWGDEAKAKMARGWNPKPLRKHRIRRIVLPSDLNLDLLTHDQIVATALPYRRESAIYFLIRRGKIVYVGQSVHVMARLAEHGFKRRIAFDSVAFLFCSRDELDIREAAYIKSLAPEHNVLCPDVLP